MSSVLGGNPDVETFLSRLIEGKFEIDTTHPDAKALQSALHTYHLDKIGCTVPTAHIGEYTRGAIGIAISQGVIKPRREDLDNLSHEIINKKVTEQDLDRVEGDNGSKKYLKGMWDKFLDKSQSEIVEMLFSAIRTQGLHLALLLINLAR